MLYTNDRQLCHNCRQPFYWLFGSYYFCCCVFWCKSIRDSHNNLNMLFVKLTTYMMTGKRDMSAANQLFRLFYSLLPMQLLTFVRFCVTICVLYTSLSALNAVYHVRIGLVNAVTVLCILSYVSFFDFLLNNTSNIIFSMFVLSHSTNICGRSSVVIWVSRINGLLLTATPS